jgi:hypothetical protein
MSVQSLALWPLSWRNAIECIAHVCPDILIPLSPHQLSFVLNHGQVVLARRVSHTVFIQAQRTARVLNEQIQQPNLVVSDLRKIRHHLISYQIGAAGLGGESKLLLEPGHCAGSSITL